MLSRWVTAGVVVCAVHGGRTSPVFAEPADARAGATTPESVKAPAGSPMREAEANDAEGAPSARAAAHVARGIQARKSGDDRAALAEFEAAYALLPSAEALAQRALAEQALGRWVDAYVHLEGALGRADEPWIIAHRPTLEAALDEIASRLGMLDVSCNVDGAEVVVDGEPRGRTPLSRAPVVAGQSVIEVRAPGHFAVTRQVQIDARGLSRVDVTLTALPEPIVAQRASRNASDAASTEPTSARSTLMYASLGLAAAGLTLGAVGYVVREVNVGLYNDDSRCSQQEGVLRPDECKDEYDAWRLGQTLAIAGAVSAAVFGGVGLYLWLDRPEPGTSAGVLCGPSGGLGVGCSGRF